MKLAITYWMGHVPFCEACSHYHPNIEACLCPDCGRPEPCGKPGHG